MCSKGAAFRKVRQVCKGLQAILILVIQAQGVEPARGQWCDDKAVFALR